MVSQKKRRSCVFTRDAFEERNKKHNGEMNGVENYCSHGSSNSGGVAVLIKNGVDCIIHSTIVDPSGRYLILKVEIEDKSYILTNIYAPNKDKDLTVFFRNILKVFRDGNRQ